MRLLKLLLLSGTLFGQDVYLTTRCATSINGRYYFTVQKPPVAYPLCLELGNSLQVVAGKLEAIAAALPTPTVTEPMLLAYVPPGTGSGPAIITPVKMGTGVRLIPTLGDPATMTLEATLTQAQVLGMITTFLSINRTAPDVVEPIVPEATLASYTVKAQWVSPPQVTRNGLVLSDPHDYSTVGQTIHFHPASRPQVGDIVLFRYRPLPIPIASENGLKIENAFLPVGLLDQTYSAQLTASGGSPPYTWRMWSGTIGGLDLTPAGEFTGTPTTIANVVVIMEVADLFGYTAYKDFPVSVTP